MIELDINKPKNFKFDINIDGITTDVLTGFLRLEINNIEYGFPAVITNESISADIPSLKTIVNREIKSGDKINARLDVNGDGYYMAPWSEELVVKSAVVVEAKLVESDKPIIQIKETKNTKVKKEIKPIKEETIVKPDPKPKVDLSKVEITKEMIYNYMEKNNTTNESIKDVLYEQASMKLGDDNKTLLKFFIGFYDKKNIKKMEK